MKCSSGELSLGESRFKSKDLGLKFSLSQVMCPVGGVDLPHWWYRIAARLGDTDAHRSLNRLRQMPYGVRE